MPKEIKEIKEFLVKASKTSNVFDRLMDHFALNPNSKKPMKKGRKQRKTPRQVHLEKEIRHLPPCTDDTIRKSRLRPIVDLFRGYLTDMVVEKDDLDALQRAAEEQLVKIITATNKITTRSGRVTIEKYGFDIVMAVIRD